MANRSIIFPRGMVRSAGAVVWRFAPHVEPAPHGSPIPPGDIQVLLVHRPRYRDWSWPKGKSEPNEPLPVTAVREVEEETGRVISLGAPMTTQRYRLGSGHIKEVYYWSGEVTGKGPAFSTRHPVARASKKEIDISQWVSPDRARAMITRKGDRRLLTELIGRAARGELRTSTIVLLRHANAVSRGKWKEGEATRPLTRMGVAQSLDIVPLLSAFGVQEVTSSPWLRCKQTILPYVTLGSAELKLEDALTEESVRANPKSSSKLIERLLTSHAVPTVVSYHGPGLEALEKPLRELSSRRVIAAMDHPDPVLRKAEMLIAHITQTSSPKVLDVGRHFPLTKLTVN